VLEPHRAALYRFCRGLTGSAWDAEDLVQDTLARAMTRAAETYAGIADPRAWLFRVARNLAVDEWRRHRPLPVAEVPERAAPDAADPAEVRDALAAAALLPPQAERRAGAAGGVRPAAGRHRRRPRHDRGRGRRADPAPRRPAAASTALLDRLVDAFGRYDVDEVAALFRDRAVAEVVGVAVETGRDEIRDSSLTHVFVLEAHEVRYAAERVDVLGEQVVVLREALPDGRGPLLDAFRVEELDGAVQRVRWYYYCPEVLAEIAAELGVPVRTHGHLHG
jgi:RNA polymerase sigma-70 factor (ECF subfamily)